LLVSSKRAKPMKLGYGLLSFGLFSVVALGQTEPPDSQQLFDSQSIAVTGAVLRPGTFKIDRPITILEAVVRSGGPQPNADRKSIQIIRLIVSPIAAGTSVQHEKIKVDLDAILRGLKQANIYLQPGDTIDVPRKANSYPVLGAPEFMYFVAPEFRN
jgi:hypothetical protein